MMNNGHWTTVTIIHLGTGNRLVISCTKYITSSLTEQPAVYSQSVSQLLKFVCLFVFYFNLALP